MRCRKLLPFIIFSPRASRDLSLKLPWSIPWISIAASVLHCRPVSPLWLLTCSFLFRSSSSAALPYALFLCLRLVCPSRRRLPSSLQLQQIYTEAIMYSVSSQGILEAFVSGEMKRVNGVREAKLFSKRSAAPEAG